ncbi:hypothetical protein [Acinetobacter sp.]|uniref:hypothetical protein n=1 Tax=Acinetobacter sp. TaxID=472 RepID=UPI0035AF76EA
MMSKLSISALLFTASISHAELSSLNQQEMQQTSGQGGADLSLTMSLNHRYANDMSLTDISERNADGKVINAYYGYNCVQDIQCRFAFSPNNHKDGDNQKWLVFKQIQGTVQIDKFSLAGTTIQNKDGNPQTAMNLSFFDDKPLKIRNLGFDNLSVETDDSNVKGYLQSSVYSQYKAYSVDANGKKTTFLTDVPAFDKGTETGFMGLNMHGNLHMNGDLKIFSYNCTGASGSRC